MTYFCYAIIKTSAYFPLQKLFIHCFYKSHLFIIYFDNAYYANWRYDLKTKYVKIESGQANSITSQFNVHNKIDLFLE